MGVGNHCGCGCGCNEPNDVTNSYNTTYNIDKHYHGRQVCVQPQLCCSHYPAYNSQHHHHCGCVSDTACCNGTQYNASLPMNTPKGDYLLIEDLAPGKYMITDAKNVQDVNLTINDIAQDKTIGSIIEVKETSDLIVEVVNPQNVGNTCIQLTKV